jgi:hypothetical protein
MRAGGQQPTEKWAVQSVCNCWNFGGVRRRHQEVTRVLAHDCSVNYSTAPRPKRRGFKFEKNSRKLCDRLEKKTSWLPDLTCELRCQKSNDSTVHLEHCTSETKCLRFRSIQDMFPKSPKTPCCEIRTDEQSTYEQSTPSEKKKPRRLKACMAVPANQSNKSIYHDSSEDHGSSAGDPESICGDWEEYSSYTPPNTNGSNQSGDSEAESESQSPQARRGIKFNTKSQGYKGITQNILKYSHQHHRRSNKTNLDDTRRMVLFQP